MANTGLVLPRKLTFQEMLEQLLKEPRFAKPNVTVLLELYQGTSKLLPASAKDSGGLCHGMAVEWIKANSLAGGQVQFRKTAASDWKTFATTQETINHKKSQGQALLFKEMVKFNSLKKASDELTEKQKYAMETGVVASIQHFFTPPMASSEIVSANNDVRGQLGQTSLRMKRLMDIGTELLAGAVFQDPADHHKMTRVAHNSTLDLVVLDLLLDQGAQPAYYMINMLQPGDRSLGHAIGLHAAYRPRLLDANGCELQFASMTVLSDFLDEYWKIYAKFAQFGAAKVDLYRYDIRLAGGDVHDPASIARAKFKQGMTGIRTKGMLNDLLQ